MLEANSIAVEEPRSFRLDRKGFAEVRRKMIARIVVVSPFLLVTVWYFDGRVQPHRNLFDFVMLPIILAIVSYQQVRRAHANWDLFELQFRGDKLVRRLPGYPDLEIAPDEIKRIVESPGGLVLKTSSRLKALGISKHLLGYDDFCARLRAWVPAVSFIPVKSSARSSAYAVVSVLGCVVLFWTPMYVMYTPHRELILPLGIASFVSFVSIIVVYWRSAHTPKSFKYVAWVLPALPLMAMLMRLT